MPGSRRSHEPDETGPDGSARIAEFGRSDDAGQAPPGGRSRTAGRGGRDHRAAAPSDGADGRSRRREIGDEGGGRTRRRGVGDHRDADGRRDAGGARDAEGHRDAEGGRRDAEGGRHDAADDARNAEADRSDGTPGTDRDAAGDERGARGGRAGRRGRTAGRRAESGPPPDDEARAKEICLRLLTDRARTVKELRDALHRKEIPDDVADRVLERFDEVGLVDDEAFAGQWVRSRHNHRGLGRRAIAQELHRKGVEKEVADTALAEIDAESEQAKARELVGKKMRTVRVGTREERAAASRRLVGMLARKGYGAGVAYAVVREAIAARGAEEDELGDEPADD